MAPRTTSLIFCALAALSVGCDSGMMVAVLPPLGAAPTTQDSTIVPTHPVVSPPDPGSPADPMVRSGWLAKGYGDYMSGAGEAPMALMPPGQTAPAAGPSPQLLVRFVHITDIHISDDESPNRACFADVADAVTAGAFRPQEDDECRVLDAAVRTIDKINEQLPISFVLTGGDNSDNTQTNEVRWFMQIMDGAPKVKCDSGAPNDPVPGPNNDGKDPFKAVGLAMPWWWVTGNHDVLVQGNFVIDDAQVQTALGTDAPLGTRDFSKPGGPLTSGPVIADPARMPLVRKELMKLIASDQSGHGIGADQVASGKAFYSFDVDGTPLRFIILDTGTETGSDDGIIHQADVDSTLKPMFDQAKAAGKLVVIASHHSSSSLTDGSGYGGTKQADALTEQQWIDFLGGYGNVIFSIVGHAHANRVRYISPTAGASYWEVMTSALVDYPHQFRLIEIWDEDNGWLRLHGTVTNYATDGDPVALEGKKLGVADYISGWAPDGSGTAADRNVDVYIPKP